uniref:phosphate/phosphite/phosphonate ABC transporter substrate-binding protein n=1 Tax=Thaumasiovibrio occultus TaxID=1891184 RepID=UPI000B3634CB|nr:phosphate/phosphite/phosphonate ABC transporter substrate-binding protein [Thaumasiovibrio occultus]
MLAFFVFVWAIAFWSLMGSAYAQAVSAEADGDTEVITFGVVPQQSAARLVEQWGPLLQAWSEISGIELRFATAPDIPTFEQRLAAGEYDIAYMNPYHFTLFHTVPGYQALARARNKAITGIIVASAKWQGDVNHLAGQTLAFPAPRAFAATLLTRSELVAQSIPILPKFVGSHDSVYLAVAKGLYPAGGGIMRTFNSIDPAIRDQLQIIYQTSSYTSHAIATHPKLASETVSRLQVALAQLDAHPLALESFEMLSIDGLQHAQNGDWQDVADLNIELDPRSVEGVQP